MATPFALTAGTSAAHYHPNFAIEFTQRRGGVGAQSPASPQTKARTLLAMQQLGVGLASDVNLIFRRGQSAPSLPTSLEGGPQAQVQSGAGGNAGGSDLWQAAAAGALESGRRRVDLPCVLRYSSIEHQVRRGRSVPQEREEGQQQAVNEIRASAIAHGTAQLIGRSRSPSPCAASSPGSPVLGAQEAGDPGQRLLGTRPLRGDGAYGEEGGAEQWQQSQLPVHVRTSKHSPQQQRPQRQQSFGGPPQHVTVRMSSRASRAGSCTSTGAPASTMSPKMGARSLSPPPAAEKAAPRPLRGSSPKPGEGGNVRIRRAFEDDAAPIGSKLNVSSDISYQGSMDVAAIAASVMQQLKAFPPDPSSPQAFSSATTRSDVSDKSPTAPSDTGSSPTSVSSFLSCSHLKGGPANGKSVRSSMKKHEARVREMVRREQMKALQQVS